jgi:hypothetical protein
MDESNAPATKDDLQGSFEQLRSEMRARHDDLKKAIRHREARILQVFHSFAESNQQRIAPWEGNVTTVIARLATLETRMLEVEKRLNMPPAA